MMRLLRNIIVFVAGILAGRSTRSGREEPDPRTVEIHDALPFWLHGWKGFFKRFAVLLPFLVLGGFLLAASGIIPLKASSGHFAITAWFLEFSMSRSVATHSMGIKAPPLDDQALVVKGAGHYETGCQPCHGGVSDVRPQIPRRMTPHPPSLPEVVPKWSPEELFYIAKHGVKFTGMPAFPSLERDDEVWAVVAFLLRLPEMDVPEYQRLVFGEDAEATPETAPIAGLPTGDEPAAVIETCRRCHGEAGRGRDLSAFPRLAGQRPNYLYAALFAYANGERNSGMMEPIAAGLTADEMREIAEYYARAQVQPALGAGIGSQGDVAVNAEVQASIERGRAIAQRGIRARKVPSCQDCHGPNRIRTNPFYPVLAGQFAEYLVLQLELFKTGHRGGSAYAHLMQRTASQLTKEQMRDVALYYESLGGAPVTPLAPYMESLIPTGH